MDLLSRTEEMLLLAVWQLQGDAYGAAIRTYLSEQTGEEWSIGGVYAPLDRLVRKGCLTSYQGDPTPERGGRSKRFFQLTPNGVAALTKIKSVQDALWTGLPDLSFSAPR